MGKRVIIIGPLPPPYGGVAIFMNALCELSAGSDFTFWAYGDEPHTETRARYVNYRRLELVPRLLREGRGARIVELTHFHLEYPHPVAVPVWLSLRKLLKFQWVKILFDGSLPVRYPHFSTMQRALFRRVVRAIDEFIVVSEELAEWLRTEIKVRQKITCIAPLLPTAPGFLQKSLGEEWQKAIASYLKHDKRVCSVGVFIADYGFQHVAEAVANLRRETGADIGLLLVDGAYLNDEKLRADTLQDHDWITVLENVPNPEMNQMLRQSDVFVRGFGRESYGLARIEALWQGVPVIATNTGETRGMAVYDYGDVPELTRLLHEVLSGLPNTDNTRWAEIYRREAQQNFAALIRAIQGV